MARRLPTSRRTTAFMHRTALALPFSLGLAALILTGCNGGGSSTPPPPPPPGKGALYVLAADAPLCDILALRLTLTGLTLTPQGGGSPATVISSASSIKVNFGALRDFTSILALAGGTNGIPEGTYTQATITFSVPQIVVFPVSSLTVNASTMAPTVNIEPPLQIVKDKVSALRMEFDLVRSVELNAQGQATGNLNPTFRLSGLTAADSQGFGQMDDLVGFVRSVTPSSPGPGFTGSFLLQLFSSSFSGAGGPAVNVNLTSSTQLFGIPALNQLPTGSFVEVDGFVDQSGNVVANSVEVEDREFPEQNKVAFIGFVTSLIPPTGDPTGFNLYVRQIEPDIFDVPLDSVVVVSFSPTTVFQFSSRATNFVIPALLFNSMALTPGQEVIVHGKFTKPASNPPEPPPPTTVAADTIYLKPQTIEGKFSAQPPAPGPGAFRFNACASLLRATPTIVITSPQTAFVNVTGLTGLSVTPTLLVKGLPFFSTKGGIIQGVTVAPRTLVILAKQVHQL